MFWILENVVVLDKDPFFVICVLVFYFEFSLFDSFSCLVLVLLQVLMIFCLLICLLVFAYEFLDLIHSFA